MKRAALALILAGTVLASPPAASAAQSAPASAKASIGTWGVDPAGMSKTVRAGDDFYTYVNERWLKTTSLPTGLPAVDTFTLLYLENEQKLKTIVQSLAAAPQRAGSDEQRIADLYKSYMDVDRQNRLGLEPIRRDLADIAAIRDKAGVARAMTLPWQAAIMETGVLNDALRSDRYIATIAQGDVTLPSAEFYLKEGAPYEGVRTAFKAYMTDVFRKAGYSDPAGRADRVFALEAEMARRNWTPLQMRDTRKTNNNMTIAELKAYAPGFPWDELLKARGFDKQQRLNLFGDTAIKELAVLFAATPLDTLKDYLAFHLINEMAPSLSEDWQKLHFGFNFGVLYGIPEMRPLELRAVANVGTKLGEPLGRIYAERHFPPAYKAQASEMVGYIRDTFDRRIGALEWMDEPTKAEAKAKLAAVTYAIGFPDRWHDYSSLTIRADDLVGNLKRIKQWERRDELAKLSEKRRTWEFPYTTYTVNAGYSQSNNSITFPAGILLPPFFDPNADKAVNFGAIGAVIGHEFGHGFDDQGSRSDGKGQLRDWWSARSRAEFEKRTSMLVDQYSSYEVVPGVFINGRQNLGENIGDLGGASIAFDAYQQYVKDKSGGTAPVIDGFTGNQRFFLAWAQQWRSITLPEEARRLVLTDNHSAGQFRANGVVRNMDAWYEAFGIKPGDKLYLPPEQRVRTW